MHRATTFLLLLTISGCSDTVPSEPWEVSEQPPVDERADEVPDRENDQEMDTERDPETDSEPEPETEPAPAGDFPDDANEFWSGLWRVDQPVHATYEGTVYDFAADGTLAELRSVFLSRELHGEVGVVARCNESQTETDESCSTNGTECETTEYTRCLEWGTHCTFGDRWGSPDERTLLIEGDCSDGASRVIELRFPDQIDDRFAAPDEIVVEGETWQRDWFQWAWTRCHDGADTCLPSF